jgi:hypothetical protein
MLKYIDYAFADSTAAEAPLVIIYIAALIFFTVAWSNFSPPTTSILELHSTAGAKYIDKNYALLP